MRLMGGGRRLIDTPFPVLNCLTIDPYLIYFALNHALNPSPSLEDRPKKFFEGFTQWAILQKLPFALQAWNDK